MKKMTCECCGRGDMLREDGVFICQSCGTKYSVEELSSAFTAQRREPQEQKVATDCSKSQTFDDSVSMQKAPPITKPRTKKALAGKFLYARYLYGLLSIACFAIGGITLFFGLILQSEVYTAIWEMLMILSIPFLIFSLVLLIFFLNRPKLPKTEVQPLRPKTQRLCLIISTVMLVAVCVPIFTVSIWASNKALGIEETFVGTCYVNRGDWKSDVDRQVTFFANNKCCVRTINNKGYTLAIEEENGFYEVSDIQLSGGVELYITGIGDIDIEEELYRDYFSELWNEHEEWVRQDAPINIEDYTAEGKSLDDMVQALNDALERKAEVNHYDASDAEYISATRSTVGTPITSTVYRQLRGN